MADSPLDLTEFAPFAFDNSYARLPANFYAKLAPTPVSAPKLVRINQALARQIGVDAAELATPAGIEMLAGNAIPPGAEPIAMAYAGHQFGGWSPQLGDGRAILLGEIVGPDGVRRDIQLKGSGRTPFSRMGDGRAALGPVLREYMMSEAMHALGVPTTRSLAAVTTGQEIARETMLPGAVLTRVATSHVRVGTFEFFAARREVDSVRLLADYVIARHYPEAAESEHPYRALLDAVIARTAGLIARWQLLGFIHGVMNTDNQSIAAETIDYGPCAFMDSYDPDTVYSSIDTMGRYAYGNQPTIAHWNLSRLAICLLPLLGKDQDAAVEQAQAAIDAFPPLFEAAYQAGLRAKLGLTLEREGDQTLAQDLLDRMTANKADFTLTFRRLSDDGDTARSLFADPAAFDEWAVRWRERLALEESSPTDRHAAMRAVNPAFIPRNHRVEAVIQAAQNEGDFSKLDEFLAVVTKPFDDQPDFAAYAEPPRPEEVVRATFCGT